MHSADEINECPLVIWARHMYAFHAANRQLHLSIAKGGLDITTLNLISRIKQEYPNQKIWFDFK